MRMIQKYKSFSKTYFPLLNVPKQKILKFHRSKWKKVQRLLLKEDWAKRKFRKKRKIKIKIKFKDSSKPFVLTKRWERCRFAFRSRLSLKKSIRLLFLHSAPFKSLKNNFYLLKNKDYNSFVKNSLFKMEYRLDLLLVRLNFFFNIFLAKKNIFNKLVFKNNLYGSALSFLQAGDIIYIPSFFKLKVAKDYRQTIIFSTFLEVDFYTNTIVILKDLQKLTKKDFYLLTRSLYNVFNLKDGLFK